MEENNTLAQRRAASREKLRLAEEAVYTIVKPVIDTADPEQLLKMGCPADEYDPVCRRIASGIVREKVRSVAPLSNLLALCWHYSFGVWGEQVSYHESFTRIAEKLHPLLPTPTGCRVLL